MYKSKGHIHLHCTSAPHLNIVYSYFGILFLTLQLKLNIK